MGLDCYLERRDKEEVKFPEDINLCGGMFSGNGSDRSFRGKVYNEIFETLTGYSLYSDLNEGQVAVCAEILSEKVDKLYKDLDDSHEIDGDWSTTVGELRDLVKLFNSAAENNCIMIAWY